MKAATAKAKSYTDAVEGEQVEFFEVDSTRLVARGFNKAKLVIYVRFPDGRQYRYKVPSESVWKDFERAKSAGSFLATTLNKCQYEKVEDWK